ncbi:MAG TPA: hypothetical protein VHZ74_10750 [Bryobacteraceae bacterium]|jgi:hypothetical protein|nr:hypothetical protein [Bryobacteraceae bacterium]
MTPPQRIKLQLQAAATKAASFSLAPVDQKLNRFRELVVTLDITAAERDTGDETYDVYITTSDGVSSWDLIHFPQVITTGAKRYMARILADQIPQIMASNGAATNEGILLISSTNATKTLAAGSVRHGNLGHQLGYELVIAGTVATGISFSLQVEGRA